MQQQTTQRIEPTAYTPATDKSAKPAAVAADAADTAGAKAITRANSRLPGQSQTSPRLPLQTIELNFEKIAEFPEWKDMLMEIIGRENFNPWNMDIGGLADSYVKKVREAGKLNLRISANVVLAASIFLRYKSDYWKLVEEEPQNFGILIPDNVISELVIPELSPSFRNTTRKITLNELISAVEDAISKEKKKAHQEKKPAFPQEVLLKMAGTVEFFEKKLAEFYGRIVETADKEGMVLFSALLKEKTAKAVVESLVLLLHLANSQKVTAWQDEFFGEIFIVLGREPDARNN